MMTKKGRLPTFRTFCLDLLAYKKMTTAVNVLCNVAIFSHRAVVTFCVRQILNRLTGTPGQALHSAWPYFAAIAVVSLIRIAAIMCCAVLDTRRAYFYQGRLRMNVLRLLLRKRDVAAVSGQTGALFEVLDDDVPASVFPMELLTEVTGYFLYTLIALGMLLAINWRLTLFIVVPLSVALYGVQRLSERMKERRKRNREAHDAASVLISDVTGAALAIQTAGATQAVLARYEAVNAARRAAVVKDAVFNERVTLLLNGAVYIGTALMMLLAAQRMGQASFGVGDFSLFVAHLGTLADLISRLVELAREVKNAEVSYERIVAVVGEDNAGQLAQPAEIALHGRQAVSAPEKPPERFTSLEVKDLRFSYGGGEGFRDVSFAVRPGELVVVAGGMASGKSTLLSVLMGLMPPDGGEICWNGEPFEPYDRAGGRVAGAPQRGGFFAQDLRTNLCLDRQADDSRIAWALHVAALEELLTGDEAGLHKDIGDRGDRLSGGQRQRLSIARTLLRGAAVNIFDDCVSALDEATCRTVLRRLRATLRDTGCCAIIATNARAFLEASDAVLFMANGRVEAVASFAALRRDCAALRAVVAGREG